MNFSCYSEVEIERWLQLRAIEWVTFPAFISQPLAPVMFIFFPWYWVIAAIAALGILWSFVRYLCVNVTIASIACSMVIWTRWPSAIGSAIYLLFIHYQPVPALIALIWPLLSVFVRIPGKVAVVALALAEKIGFVFRNTGLEERRPV